MTTIIQDQFSPNIKHKSSNSILQQKYINSRIIKSFPSPIVQKRVQLSQTIFTKKTRKNSKKQDIITHEEYTSVIEQTKKALTIDFESIITKNEPQVISNRNKIYLQAIADDINADSPVALRLPYIQQVIEYFFESVEPPNHYTAITDRKHFKEVADLAVKYHKQALLDKGCLDLYQMRKILQKQQNWSASMVNVERSPTIDYELPLTLIISCWCHDIERFLPCTKCTYLVESVDHYRKQIAHPITSARICCEVVLKNAPLTVAEIEHIKQMIMHHDMPHPMEDVYVLGECLMVGVRDTALMTELQLLMDADALSFFHSTLALFIDYKAKKSSGKLIWQRVICNVIRLRPHLRLKAAEAIEALSDRLKSKMDIDRNELNKILQQK